MNNGNSFNIQDVQGSIAKNKIAKEMERNLYINPP